MGLEPKSLRRGCQLAGVGVSSETGPVRLGKATDWIMCTLRKGLREREEASLNFLFQPHGLLWTEPNREQLAQQKYTESQSQ